MPRKPRIISSTGIYHIILRSVNQHIIFEEEADYYKFLSLLSDCKDLHDIDIYAYCLMDNHVHLLLHASPDDLSTFFQSLGSRFVRWYNNKYARSGHLFQERFHSIPVETSSQYLSTLIYIHNNPVKGAACRFASEYRWSSYNAFYGQKNPLIDLAHSYEIAGSKEFLLQYFASHDDIDDDSINSGIHQPSRHFVTDEKALAIFKAVTHLSSPSEVDRLPKTRRNQYIRILHQKMLTQKQIARVLDISISTVKRIVNTE